MKKRDLIKALHARRDHFPNEIISCQNELDLLCKKESEEKIKKSQQFESLKKPLIDQRTELIRTVPNFWVYAIESHPKLCLLLNDEVIEVLRYMTKIETEDAAELKNGMSFKINFFFKENPYIENDKLTKEFLLSTLAEGEIISSSTKILWKSNKKVGLHNESFSSSDSSQRKENFFVWFDDNETPEDDIFTYFQAICQNPLPYSPFFYDYSDEEMEENHN